MFDCLLGKKFTAKCKQSIKCTKVRSYERRKKKQAVLNFLKKDIADLLTINEESNAFARMDELVVAMNHVACYDMIEKLCEQITSQLPILQKQRECSEEATEAVATLIYAAARFSDLPELCDLRRAFTARYASTMESSVNQEFVEKISKKHFSKERKLKMMQEIANEFSVKWDSKDFGQKKLVPAISVQSQTVAAERNEKRAGSFNPENRQTDLGPVVKISRQEVQLAANGVHVIGGSELNKKVELGHKQEVKEPHGASPRGLKLQEDAIGDYKRQAVGQRSISKRAINPLPPYIKVSDQKDVVRAGRGREDDRATVKPERVIQVNIIPPNLKGKNLENGSSTEEKQTVLPANPPVHRTPPYLKPVASKPTRPTEHKESVIGDSSKDDPVEKPMPRSVRRNKHSIASNHPKAEEEFMDADERIDQIVYGRRHGNRRGTRSFDADYGEEEKAMDRLLLHYSLKGKGTQPEQQRKAKRDHSTHREVEVTEAKLGTADHPLARVASLPPERTKASNVERWKHLLPRTQTEVLECTHDYLTTTNWLPDSMH